MEPHSQTGGEDSTADLGVDGIKTEIDGLMDSDGKFVDEIFPKTKAIPIRSPILCIVIDQ